MPPKAIHCCLCKRRCKPGARRTVVNVSLKKYLKKCLGRSIEEREIICNACYAAYQRSEKNVTASRVNSDVSKDTPSDPLISPKSITLQIRSTPRSHRCCVVCKKDGSPRIKLTTIPKNAQTQAFVQCAIFIDSKNRCCPHHIDQSYFKTEALHMISANKDSDIFSRTDIIQLLNNMRSMMKTSKYLNFDIPSVINDEDCFSLTGLSNEQFSDLVSHLVDMKTTSKRSVRTSLAIFLVKMRTGLPNKILSILFALKLSNIQRAIQSIRASLMTNFVPHNIGFQHISHEEFCQNHTTPIAKQLFTTQSNQAVLVLDGTYIYIQKSSNYVFQRRSFSMHKHRPLVKPMVVVGTDGYILSILGPYYADGKNSDAAITKHFLSHNLENANTWLQEQDVCIVDRGFRDSVKFLEEHGLNVQMPGFLNKGEKQHSSSDANATRMVTKVRWVVESTNGRIKQFKFFDKVVPNTLVPYISDILQIIGAICNKYRNPLANVDPESAAIAKKMLERAKQGNVLQKYLEENNLLRKRSVYKDVGATSSDLDSFPILSNEQLRDITIGVYQLKQASSYTNEHIRKNGDYKLMFYEENPSLLKVQLQSRHSSNTAHNIWIKYTDSCVTGWYCTCKTGARVVGCCAHIASVLWYLGLWRHKEHRERPSKQLLLDASALPSTSALVRDEE